MIERCTAAAFLLVHILASASHGTVRGFKLAADPAPADRPDLDSTSMLQTLVRQPPASTDVVASVALPLGPGELPQLQEVRALGAPEDAKAILAWQMVAASAMATSEARLGFTSFLLLVLAGLRLTLQIRQKESRLPAAAPLVPEPCNEELHPEAEEEALAEEPPVEEPPAPPPRPQLQSVGAAFTVGSVLATGTRGPTLRLDIPSTPAAWPLRAILSRPSEEGPWTGFELTVDIAAACELPPLLACSLASCMPHTGGTPCLDETGPCQPQVGALLDSVGSSGDLGNGTEGSPWFFVHNGGGHLLATVSRKEGGYEVRHHDGLLWEIDLLEAEDSDEPWAMVSRMGQAMCQARSFQLGGETALKVETLPEAKSPESALLLTCMLAMTAFGP